MRWYHDMGIPRWFNSKESMYSAGAEGLIPGSGRSPGEENGDLLQYSCLGKPTERGACQATAHEDTEIRHNLATKQQRDPKAEDTVKQCSDS